MASIRHLARLSILICIGVSLAGARSSGGAAPAPLVANGAQEVTVVGVFVDSHAQQPVVVLQGKRDKRSVALVVGAAEATGIALPLQNVTPPRPLTHDLFLTLFGRLDATLTRVVINDLRDNTYFATLYLTASGSAIELDARPSDAIALAVRAKAPVYVDDRVFSKSEPSAAPRKSPSI